MQETAPQYIQRILGYVEGQDALRVQRATAGKLSKLVRGLNRKQLTWRPAPGKWSINEILAHLADTEIVASWRLRFILGANGTNIQGFDQDIWASVFNYQKADARHALKTFACLRENNLLMLKALPKEKWDHFGMHSERGKETVAHITRMFAGHDTNHLRQVEAIRVGLRGRKKR
jgi:hypothetical protein